MRLEIVETKLRAASKVALTSLQESIIYLASLLFHRKITAVPFTPVRPCDKPGSIGVIDQTILGSRHARG